MDVLSVVVPRFHSEGVRFVAIFAAVTIVLFVIWQPLGWLGLIATVWCFYFFRDPDRITPIGRGLVIAPADGVVCAVGPATPPETLATIQEKMLRVSIFMSVFNCHVNRVPMTGSVVKSVYHPGKFLSATLDKASTDNERQILAIETDIGQIIGVVQIAGLIARRIVCDVKEGDQVMSGERFGMIRFGSRVDVYLDAASVPLVAEGQIVIGGETVLADLVSTEPPRQFRLR